MEKNRRKVIVRFLERAALGLIVADVAFFIAVLRPLRSHIASKEDSYHYSLGQTLQRQKRLDRLQKLQAGFPTADQQLQKFLSRHVPPRRHAFSDAARMIRELTNRSGVQLDSVSYKLIAEKKEPLERLRIDVTVEGPYGNLMKFAHTLESAPQLVLLRDFTFSTAQGSNVSLRLGADLFLTP